MQAVCLKAKESCSSQHAHTAPLEGTGNVPSYDGGAECASGRLALACQPHNCGAHVMQVVKVFKTIKAFLVRAPQLFRSEDSKESCSQSKTAAQHRVQPTCGSLRDLQAFFWLWAFPALTAYPRPPTRG